MEIFLLVTFLASIRLSLDCLWREGIIQKKSEQDFKKKLLQHFGRTRGGITKFGIVIILKLNYFHFAGKGYDKYTFFLK